MLNNNKKQETQFFGTKCGNANSIAAGYATETTNYGEIATGILNKSTKGDNPNSPEGVVGDPKATLFSVGCGTKGERKNALEVKGDGSVIISRKDGSDVNINEEIKYLKNHCVVLGDEGQVSVPYKNEFSYISPRRVNIGDYTYADFKTILYNDTLSYYIYDSITDEIIKVTENKFNAIEINPGDFFNTEEPLNLSHTLYLDNEKTGNISDLEELTIKESDIFEGLPYVCEDDTLEDDEAPQYIYDATDKKWIIVNESLYISDANFFNTEKPLDLSHKLFCGNYENIFDYNRIASSFSTALGYSAQATGAYCTALGFNTQAAMSSSIAVGSNAQATGAGSIAIGNIAEATNDDSIALGTARSTGDCSIAVGSNAQATGTGSTALGRMAQVTNKYATALGYGAKATNDSSIALGKSAQATGDFSTAIGWGANAMVYDSIALGSSARATGDYSIAIGFAANTSTVSKYALGGADKNKLTTFNIEEITYSQYGNKKYLIGLGGYDGTNIAINNEAGEKVLNPNIKSVQEIINGKVDLTPIVTSTDATISLQPNKKYEITAGDTLVLTFTEPSDKTTKNEYLCSINIGAFVPTITFPKEIIWDVEPVIAANKHYEINVQYSQGKYWGTIRAWEFPNDEVVLDETEQYVKPVLFAKNSNVTLKRALKTGQENSLCLPFAMTQEQISEIWGANTEIYYVSGSDAKNIYFNTTTNIEAGFPCLIKPERINTNNVYNIHNVPASSWYSKDTVPEYIGENIRSVGLFSPSVVKAGSYVFSGGKLYHLTSDMNSKGFRIYFEDLV